MAKGLLKALFAAGAALFLSAQAAPEQMEYTLTPIMSGGALQAVEVDLRFRGEAEGRTHLHLPNEWAGETELYRAVSGLEAVSGAVLSEGEGPAMRVLTHRPNARVHLRYRLIQEREGPPTAGGRNAYRVVIQPDYMHLIGNAAFVAPRSSARETPVRVRMRNLPRGWAFASDLEHAGLTLETLRGSVLVAGDFRVLRSADRSIRVAIRGVWSFSDESFLEEVAKIVSGHRAFWGDRPSPFLVTVLPLETPSAGWRSVGGTGLGDAFAFFATDNIEAGPITRTLAHESLHAWIPGRLGASPGAQEALQYWFSEGFTDFYTARLLVREGVWGPQEFAADLNAMLLAYAGSSVREAPNSRILQDFWRDGEVKDLPYQRGRLAATVWDYKLRMQGASLDGLMLSLLAPAGQMQAAPAHLRVARALDGANIGFGADYAAFIERGEAILLSEDAFAPCGRITTRRAGRFHRGFDIEATSANLNIISGVDPALPAYAAGLRDGMVLLGRDSGVIGDATQQLTYRVRDGQIERAISYMPRGYGELIVQQLELTPGLEGAALAQCLRVLGG